jgi:shikimate kinase
LLQVEDPYQKILALLEERDPIYSQVATHIVSTDTRSPRVIAQQIVDSL